MKILFLQLLSGNTCRKYLNGGEIWKNRYSRYWIKKPRIWLLFQLHPHLEVDFGKCNDSKILGKQFRITQKIQMQWNSASLTIWYSPHSLDTFTRIYTDTLKDMRKEYVLRPDSGVHTFYLVPNRHIPKEKKIMFRMRASRKVSSLINNFFAFFEPLWVANFRESSHFF